MKTLTQYALAAAILALFCALVVLAPEASAQKAEFKALTEIPKVTSNQGSLAQYINALFWLAIAVGALLAVLKIALAGFSYMFSDVVTNKQAAKGNIFNALLGLGILLAMVIILETIYPGLTNLQFLSNAPTSTFQNTTNNTPNNTPICASGLHVVYTANATVTCQTDFLQTGTPLVNRECPYSDQATRDACIDSCVSSPSSVPTDNTTESKIVCYLNGNGMVAATNPTTGDPLLTINNNPVEAESVDPVHIELSQGQLTANQQYIDFKNDCAQVQSGVCCSTIGTGGAVTTVDLQCIVANTDEICSTEVGNDRRVCQ